MMYGTSVRIWVLSELFYPERVSTGYFLTGIAEGLAREYDVKVLCAQPTYASRGLRAARSERRNGVEIRRYRTTAFSNENLLLRMMNLVTISLSLCMGVLLNARRDDIVIAVTNPPLLPLLVSLAKFLRGFKYILIVHDVFPDSLYVAGLVSKDSRLFQVLAAAVRASYRSTDRIVAIGDDMRELIRRKLGTKDHDIVTIPNWGDTQAIKPEEGVGNDFRRSLGLRHEFVVLHYGSVGRTHDFDCLIEAAASLRGEDQIRFVFSGFGSQFAEFEERCARNDAENVTFLPRIEEEKLSPLLNACDVAVVSFKPGAAGVSVPSRIYNILAAGRPIIALVDKDSETARLIAEHKVGWVLAPGDGDSLARLILDLKESRRDLAQMGATARSLAERVYSADVVQAKYRELVARVAGPRSLGKSRA